MKITQHTTLAELDEHLRTMALHLQARRVAGERVTGPGVNVVVDHVNGHVGRGYGETLAEAIASAIEDWLK